ncbi:pyroglutamyl-peptidase I [Evansella tamaricis]|uniref:Pyroglutamyl-peptidase I n=1 Tax=Evansella tamaricis TaxID=2069301 RepID=A0ABS6JCQ3_9BACI|nr:pyroglutamyl-peptidase I [Evansella tamaricis]MBU9711436.1 pyroglutamyl-peptidase I [Evansella tamaricis]
MKKKILVSGFEPFGDVTINPTMGIIEKLNRSHQGNVELHTIILPVVYNECANVLIEEINKVQPDIVISLGVAMGRSAITPERIGINIQDTVGEGASGDNHGDRPFDRLIEEDGPDGLFSTIPIRDITNELKKHGIPAQISNSAGTYICNNTLYSVLLHVQINQLSIRVGFIHVPATPGMVLNKPHLPSMDLELQVKGIQTVIDCLSEK